MGTIPEGKVRISMDISREVKEKLEKLATQDKRTQNGEIEYLVEQAYDKRK